MVKFISIRSGVTAGLAPHERSPDKWQSVVNGVISEEGVKPLTSVLQPIGESFSFFDSTIVGLRGVALGSGRILYFAGYTTGTQATRQIQTFLREGQELDRQNTTVTVALTDPNAHIASAGVVAGQDTVGKVLLTLGLCRGIQYRNTILFASQTWFPGDTQRTGNAVNQLDYISPVFTSTGNATTFSAADLVDSKNSTALSDSPITAPASPFIVNLDEYTCIIGGSDNSTAATPPTSSQVNQQRIKFRWASPDTVTEWAPDLTNVPPQWFSGYLLLPSLGRVMDVVVAFRNIYVIMELGVVECVKVGGSIGFQQRTLPVTFNLQWPSFGTCVGTPRGVFFVNSSGLFQFDGMQVHRVGANADDFFNLEVIANDFNEGFVGISEYNLSWSLLQGLHVPQLDSVMWFLQVTPGGNGAISEPAAGSAEVRTYVLVYQYYLQETTILRSEPGVVWLPLTGATPGFTSFNTTTRIGRTYRFTDRYSSNFSVAPDTVTAQWETGIFRSDSISQKLFLRRLFLDYLGTSLDGLQLYANLYHDDGNTLKQQIPLGSVKDFTGTRWKDIRVSARYVSFLLTGLLGTDTSTTLQNIGVDATLVGRRW